METVAKPDVKYTILLFLVAMNSLLFMDGDHYPSFLSMSLICVTLIYFDRKTQLMLLKSFEREERLINDLEKVTKVVSKLPAHDAAKFREIYSSL